MKDPSDQSGVGLNLHSRPTRVRKKRNFDDFEIDFVANNVKPAFTSSPLPSALKKTNTVVNSKSKRSMKEQSSSLNDSFNGSLCKNVDFSFSVKFGTDKDDIFEEDDISLSSTPIKNEAVILDTVDPKKEISEANLSGSKKRSRGRPRKDISMKLNTPDITQSQDIAVKSEVEHEAEDDSRVSLVSSAGNVRSFNVSDRVCINVSTSENDSVATTNCHSIQRRKEMRREKSSGSGRGSGLLRQDDMNNDFQGKDLSESSLQENISVFLDSSKMDEKCFSVGVKRKRGRPRRSYIEDVVGELDLGENSVQEKAAVSPNSTKTGEKRKRGRPRQLDADLVVGQIDLSKNSVQEKVTFSLDSTKMGDNRLSVPGKRARGRPRKYNLNDSSMLDKKINLSGGEGVDSDDSKNISGQGTSAVGERRRGRGRGRGVSRGRGRGVSGESGCVRGKGRSSYHYEDEANGDEPEEDNWTSGQDPRGSLQCPHCDYEANHLSTYKCHMMHQHALWVSKKCMEGESNHKRIIEKMGYISCPKCNKRTKNPSYFKHHLIWCGRENEKFECPICHKASPAMWEYQHMNAHAREKRQKEMKVEREKERQDRLERGKETESGDDGGDEVKGEESKKTKRKRKAAASALSLISSLDKGDNSDVVGDGVGWDKTKSDEDESEESSMDDSTTDDEEEEGKRKKQWTKEKKVFQVSTSTEGLTVWESLCCTQCWGPSGANVKRLHQLAKDAAQLFLMRADVPLVSDWIPVTEEERQKFVPPLGHSQPFTSMKQSGDVSDCTQRDLTTLAWGQTATVNEKLFGYTGGPIWAMEWCPLPFGCPHPQLVAVASDRQTEPQSGMLVPVHGPGLIQFWTLSSEEEKPDLSPRLAFAIAHDCGYVRSLAWCPHGGFCWPKGTTSSDDNTQEEVREEYVFPRLGLLALACSDSSVLVYAIPQVTCLASTDKTTSSLDVPIFRPTPIRLVFNTPNLSTTPCISVSWQEGDKCRYVLGGFGDGKVAMWDMSSSSRFVRTDARTVIPTRVFWHHITSVLCLEWSPSCPSQFISSDLEGVLALWDSNHPNQPVSIFRKVNRPLFRSLCWAGPLRLGFFSVLDKRSRAKPVSHELKALFKEAYPVSFHGLSRLGPEGQEFNVLTYAHPVCTWDVTFHPAYEILVTCDAVGDTYLLFLNMSRLCSVKKNCIKTTMRRSLCKQLYKANVVSRKKGEESEKLGTGTAYEQTMTTSKNSESCDRTLPSSETTPGSPVLNSKIPNVKITNSDNINAISLSSSSSFTSPATLRNCNSHVLKASMCGGRQEKTARDKETHSKTGVDTQTHDKTVMDTQTHDKIVTDTQTHDKTVTDTQTQDKTVMDTETQEEEEVIFYQESMQNLDNNEAKLAEWEDCIASRMNAVHRLRLCPSLDKDVWLASGGQAGLLRFDNLTFWAKNQHKEVYLKLDELNRSGK